MTWLLYAFTSAVTAAATLFWPRSASKACRPRCDRLPHPTILHMRDRRCRRGGAAAGIATSWIGLTLSGVATGLSWLAYFRALQLGPASRVAPIDKLSLPLTILLAAFVLGESITWKVGVGVAMMTAGALLTIL